MSDWTVKNLEDVKDSAADFGLAPQMEARFARDDLEVEQTGISYQRLAPGFRQPFAHRHGNHEELYVVVGGSGRVLLDGEVRELRRLDAVRVAPGVLRAFEGGPEGIEFLAIGPRGSDPFETEQPDWRD